MRKPLIAIVFFLTAILSSGCVQQPEYANCTIGHPEMITAVNYSPDHETPQYLRQISEPLGENVSLTGTIKTRILAQGTRSEWSYTYLETDDGKTYILDGRHWSGFPDFEYGNFHLSNDVMSRTVSITGQKATIYPEGKENPSYGDYGPQEGILITSIEGHSPMCCYQKMESGGYGPSICIWR